MSEEIVIRHCSPTLAGLKTGNIFACPFSTMKEIKWSIRRMNRILGKKGLRVLPLRYSQKWVLIYVYRPGKLKQDFSDAAVRELLEKNGYPCDAPERCIVRLIRKLKEGEEFPHEIGLFLGYPPEDVLGFIENRAGGWKCSGYWKVYGDPQKAEKTFAKYKKCTDIYYDQWQKGKSMERLTVAV